MSANANEAWETYAGPQPGKWPKNLRNAVEATAREIAREETRDANTRYVNATARMDRLESRLATIEANLPEIQHLQRTIREAYEAVELAEGMEERVARLERIRDAKALDETGVRPAPRSTPQLQDAVTARVLAHGEPVDPKGCGDSLLRLRISFPDSVSGKLNPGDRVNVIRSHPTLDSPEPELPEAAEEAVALLTHTIYRPGLSKGLESTVRSLIGRAEKAERERGVAKSLYADARLDVERMRQRIRTLEAEKEWLKRERDRFKGLYHGADERAIDRKAKVLRLTEERDAYADPANWESRWLRRSDGSVSQAPPLYTGPTPSDSTEGGEPKRCPSCNAGPDEPCAYPTEHARRLRDRIRELQARSEPPLPEITEEEVLSVRRAASAGIWREDIPILRALADKLDRILAGEAESVEGKISGDDTVHLGYGTFPENWPTGTRVKITRLPTTGGDDGEE